MVKMKFSDAIEKALVYAMSNDPRIIIFGEDVHLIRRNLYVRFGPERVRQTPISESAFLGMAVGAAMAGIKPIVEIMMIDFVGVALDALLNQASKIEFFSGNRWKVPMVVRASCGGGYGDGGQHEQCLWGLLSGIPDLSVVVPSNPADAAGLMLSSIDYGRPIVYLEHKLLADYWLDWLGRGERDTVRFDIPENGAKGEVPDPVTPVPIGKAKILKNGEDLTIISVGVGVHRALDAALSIQEKGIYAGVIDLRTISPLDKETLIKEVGKTEKVLVVDEDYLSFGLSGEIAALCLENGIHTDFARVAVEGNIPYARHLEDQTLPNVKKIKDAALTLVE